MLDNDWRGVIGSRKGGNVPRFLPHIELRAVPDRHAYLCCLMAGVSPLAAQFVKLSFWMECIHIPDNDELS